VPQYKHTSVTKDPNMTVKSN